MPRDKPKKEVEEERTPKHVNVRLSYRDYVKLEEIAEIVAKIRDDKELRRAFGKIVKEIDEETTPEKFLGFVAGLPAKGERSIKQFHSRSPRSNSEETYFVKPHSVSAAVKDLHAATKKWTKGKLRFDQKKETCPTDVRVMFYAYLRGNDLFGKDNPNVTVNKELRSWAPNALDGVKTFPRKDGSFVWTICSEIRGVEVKKTKKEPKRGKKVESSSEEEATESDEEIESESESEPEPPKKGKSKKK